MIQKNPSKSAKRFCGRNCVKTKGQSVSRTFRFAPCASSSCFCACRCPETGSRFRATRFKSTATLAPAGLPGPDVAVRRLGHPRRRISGGMRTKEHGIPSSLVKRLRHAQYSPQGKRQPHGKTTRHSPCPGEKFRTGSRFTARRLLTPVCDHVAHSAQHHILPPSRPDLSVVSEPGRVRRSRAAGRSVVSTAPCQRPPSARTRRRPAATPVRGSGA